MRKSCETKVKVADIVADTECNLTNAASVVVMKLAKSGQVSIRCQLEEEMLASKSCCKNVEANV